jgi:hypothetical protein
VSGDADREPVRRVVRSLRRPVRAVLGAAGFELRRSPSRPAAGVPPLADDASEALHRARYGVAAAFECPLEVARDTRGFSFARDGWHPWVAELHDQQRRGGTNDGSPPLLQRFFADFRPRDALEALAGFRPDAPCGLADLGPDLFWVTPWCAWTPQEMADAVRDWVGRGARDHGLVDFEPDRDGSPYHGPTSARLAEVEARRLLAAATSLRRDGYDRRFGDSLFYLVRRGREQVAVKFGGGYHRTAAMAAIGAPTIPAQLRPPLAVDVDDVDDWPQVRSGLWSRLAAIRYVDHLFDFDATAWARERGLT